MPHAGAHVTARIDTRLDVEAAVTANTDNPSEIVLTIGEAVITINVGNQKSAHQWAELRRFADQLGDVADNLYDIYAVREQFAQDQASVITAFHAPQERTTEFSARMRRATDNIGRSAAEKFEQFGRAVSRSFPES